MSVAIVAEMDSLALYLHEKLDLSAVGRFLWKWLPIMRRSENFEYLFLKTLTTLRARTTCAALRGPASITLQGPFVCAFLAVTLCN